MNIAIPVALATGLLSGVAYAQNPPPAGGPSTAQPASLAIFFEYGSAKIRPQDGAVLDQASRLYTEGKPTVMILTGSTDSTGQPLLNLRLSQQRALAVLDQLVARGIPAERFQLLAKGASEAPVPAPAGVAEPRDRRVEIAWH